MRAGGYAYVHFEPDGPDVVVPIGSTLLEAARLAGVDIDAPCGGSGRCGSCRVSAEGSLAPLTHDEGELLGGAGVAGGKRLACRARVTGDVMVRLEEAAGRGRVVTEVARGEGGPFEAARGLTEAGPTGLSALGVAVDVGTTTVVVSLVDLANGDVLATTAELSAQRAYGADVISRVTAALSAGVAPLHDAIVQQVDSLLLAALTQTGSDPASVADVVAVGNTAMTSLFLGEDVSAFAATPYEGAFVEEACRPAAHVGLASVPRARVCVPPGVSAFIGSDVVAGLLATRVAERPDPTLFIDLGTNGEIVLAAGGRLLGASTAAGPALEGAAIEHGMRATEGAIERVAIGAEGLEFGVIGERAPVGICGSGLIDLVEALLDAGVLDASGRLVDGAPGALGASVTEREGVRIFVVDRDAAILLTQHDVRQVQLAVAAVRTGVDLLLAEAGLAVAEVAEVIVAGGFGYHVRADAIARLGLIPRPWRDRVSFAGNTALEGARMLLIDEDARRIVAEVAPRVQTVDLAAHPEFQRRFLEALTFP